MTVAFAGLSRWLLIAARGGGGDLGLAERLTSAVQGLFPFVVALALRQTGRAARGASMSDRYRVPDQGARGRGRRTLME